MIEVFRNRQIIQGTVKGKARNSIFPEILVISALIIAPLLVYSHLFFSKDTSVIQFITLEWEHNALNNQSFIWHILNYMSPLFICLVLFVASCEKYKNILLAFIAYYLIEIISIVKWESLFLTIQRAEVLLFVSAVLITLLIMDMKYFRWFRNKQQEISGQTIIRELLSRNFKKLNSSIESNIRNSSGDSLLKQTYRIYHSIQLIRGVEDHSSQGSDVDQNRVYWQITVILTCAFFLNFLWYLMPEIKIIYFKGLILDSYGFPSIDVLVWYLMCKLGISLILLIWLFFTKYWWRLALIIPLMTNTYQIWEIFAFTKSIEAEGNLPLLPISLLVFAVILNIIWAIKNISKSLFYRDFLSEELTANIMKLSRN